MCFPKATSRAPSDHVSRFPNPWRCNYFRLPHNPAATRLGATVRVFAQQKLSEPLPSPSVLMWVRVAVEFGADEG